jgi:hypothetical protein
MEFPSELDQNICFSSNWIKEGKYIVKISTSKMLVNLLSMCYDGFRRRQETTIYTDVLTPGVLA